MYNCAHGHVIASLAHHMFCVLTNSDHLVIMVTASSLIETSDSERLESYFIYISHVIAALAHQMFCVLTNRDHLAIMVTASSLLKTADSERLQSSARLNVACYRSIGSAGNSVS